MGNFPVSDYFPVFPARLNNGLLQFVVVKCRPSSTQGATPNVTVMNYNEDVAFRCPVHKSFDSFDYKDNYRIVKCLSNNTVNAFNGNCQGERTI